MPDSNGVINTIIAAVMILGANIAGIIFGIGFVQKFGGIVAWAAGMGQNVMKNMDPSKNFRKNKRKQRFEKMSTGNLYQGNNRLSNRFNKLSEGTATFAKSQNKWGFLTDSTAREAIVTQQRAINSARHAQTDEAKAGQHNDDMLRSQTYSDGEEAARTGLRNDWGMSEERIDRAIAATKANGGWSPSIAVYAGKQLAATGTGYDNVEQAHKTVARISKGNYGTAADMWGYMKGANPAVIDMAASFGTHMEAWQKLMDTGQLGSADVDKVVMDAAKNTDALTAARGKPASVKRTTDVIRREIIRQNTRAANTNLSADDRNKAAAEAGRLAGVIEQWQNSAAYASPINIQHTDEILVQPTAQVRREVVQQAQQTPNIVATDPAGQPIMGPNNQPRYIPNPAYNEQTAAAGRGYGQQRPRGMGGVDPRDPNSGLGAAA